MKLTRLWMVAAATACFLACSAQVRSTDGNTSWVGQCTRDADCPGLSCLCGVCTSSCSRDSACSGFTHGACAVAGSNALAATCGSSSTPAGVCLPECPRSGCGTGRTCVDGLCTRAASGLPEAGSGGASPAGPGDATLGNGNVAISGGASNLGSGGAGNGGVAGGGNATAAGAGNADGGSGGVPMEGGPPGAGGGPTPTCNTVDFSSYQGGDPVSFKSDLLPIFGLSCVVSDCHNPHDKKAGLNLGYKCAFDANAKWKCTFPAVANPDTTTPQPDDPQTAMDVYASLLGVAQTVVSPVVRRVVPGDPGDSFLMLSLADQQNTRGFVCTNQDVSHESQPPPCGVSMPQNQDLFCQGASRAKFDAIARWIAQGAQNN